MNQNRNFTNVRIVLFVLIYTIVIAHGSSAAGITEQNTPVDGLSHIGDDSSMMHMLKKSNNNYSVGVVKLNGVVDSGQSVKLYVKPRNQEFDTLFIRTLSRPSGSWMNYLCRIPAPMEVSVAVNPCCGGLLFEPQKYGPVYFRLTHGDKKKVYLARYAASGVLLKSNSIAAIETPCRLMTSAMETPDYRISIEAIDTVLSVENYSDEEDRDELEKLVCLNGVRCENDEHYRYRRKKVLFSPSYIWFESSALLIEYDVKTKKGTISRYIYRKK